jgi:ribonucleotide reductase beta subunit family protein with ferritin-like domain
MYLQVLPKAKIDKVYNSVIYRDHLNKVNKKALENYNEFEI